MLFIRIIGLLTAAALAVALLLYLLTGERRYALVAWRIFQYALFALVLILLLLFFERVLVAL